MSLDKSTSSKVRIIPYLTIALILAGAVFRFIRFIEPRSFWIDELWVAYDISTRHFIDIFLSQNFFSHDFPVSPMGFALIVKFFVLVLGQSETAFRLFPFLCSIASLILFARLTKKWFGQHGIACVVLTFFVFNEQLIHFASQAKRYSTDLLVYLLVLSFAPALLKKIHDRKFPYHLFLAGTTMLSYFSPVFWMSVLIPIFFAELRQKNMRSIRILIVCTLQLGAFYLLFHGSAVRQMLGSPIPHQTASHFFPGQPFLQWSNVSWAFQVFSNMLLGLGGFQFPEISLLLLMVGVVCGFRRNALRSWFLLFPILLSFLLALIRIYPFQGRFIIYILPAIFFFIGEGLSVFARNSRYSFRLIGVCLTASLLFSPIRSSLMDFGVNHETEANRRAIEFLAEHLKEGDVLFISRESVLPLAYYSGAISPLPMLPKSIVMADYESLSNNSLMCYRLFHVKLEDKGFLSLRRGGDHYVCREPDEKIPFQGMRNWVFLSHYEQRMEEIWLNNFCTGKERQQEMIAQGVRVSLCVQDKNR